MKGVNRGKSEYREDKGDLNKRKNKGKSGKNEDRGEYVGGQEEC